MANRNKSRLYHVSVPRFAQQLLSHLRAQELLKPGDRVGVAVSGGIDSVALLRILLELRNELGIVLSVVHFNHKLRGAESDADEQFVAEMARQFDVEFLCDSDDVAAHAREEGVSLEAAARELRYGFFRHLLTSQAETVESNVKSPTLPQTTREGWGTPNSLLNKIATGHTLDDQAETVLMRVVRGAGLSGLGGIYPRIPVEDDHGEPCGEIIRPLLAFRRRELEQYLKDIGQPWREDSSNASHHFTRNRLRHLVLPLLEKEFNPSVAENLADLAEIARGEEDYWQNEIAGWMGTGVHWTEPEWARVGSNSSGLVQISAVAKSKKPHPVAKDATRMGHPDDLHARIKNARWLVMNASVDLMWLLSEPVAVQRRLVKAIGEHAGIPLEFKHVEEILHFATRSDIAGKELSLPLGWKLERKLQELVFTTPDLRDAAAPQDYEYELPIPGRVVVNEIGSIFEAQYVPADEQAGYNPDHLLNPDSLSGPLRVRNWRAGDRFWPAHTKSPKKIKELLQERHVAQPERRLWPVVTSGAEIVWMRGFPCPAKFQSKPGQQALQISERAHDQEFSI